MLTSPAYSLHLPLWTEFLYSHQPPSLVPHSCHPAWLYMAWREPSEEEDRKTWGRFSALSSLCCLSHTLHSRTGCRPLTELQFPRIPLPCPPTAQLHGPSSHTHYAQIRFSRLLIIFVAFCWTLSSQAISYGSSVPSVEQISPAGGSHLLRRKLTPFVW